MKQQTYPSYKDSGLEFVGVIPEHWDVQKLKYIASVRFSNVDKHTVEGERPVRLCNYVDVYYNDFITEDIDFMKATAKPEEIEKYGLKKGDVIITKDSETWDDIAVPAYVPKDLNGVICGYHLAQIRPDPENVSGKYLFMSFCARGINDQFNIETTGVTRYGLGKYGLNNALFLVPPIQEQKAIAGFLGHKTEYIDALIVEKERQIQLLQEKRTVLIDHIVTKGLDPKVSMKDTGIKWIGTIPEHWEIKRIKRIFKILNGSTPKTSEPSFWDGEILWATPDDLGRLTNDTLYKTARMLTKEGYDSCGTTLAPAGSLILSTRAPIGHLAIAGRALCTNQGCRSLVFRGNDYSRFYYYLLAAAHQELESWGQGSTFTELSRNNLENIKIVTLPFSEQYAIAEFLDREIEYIESFVMKIQESIDKFLEFRVALISDAVRGKIDVRKEVA